MKQSTREESDEQKDTPGPSEDLPQIPSRLLIRVHM